MSGMNGMNFHSGGMILNVSEWGERQFHDVINCTSTFKKGKKSDYQHFLLFPQCLQRHFPHGRQK